MRSVYQKAFAPLKGLLPPSLWSPVRAVVTAFATPFRFALRSGHFASSLKTKAVTPDGTPIPWYTYPCIQFLQGRDFSDKVIVEFGGGQSTLWWAKRAKRVITIEQDANWLAHLKSLVPSNVTLHHVRCHGPAQNMDLDHVREIFASIDGSVDIIVNDGTGDRASLLPMSFDKLSATGAILCDDSHGYGFQDSTKDMDILRVDFYGAQPGVVMANSTSVLFRPGCFLFQPSHPIPDYSDRYFPNA